MPTSNYVLITPARNEEDYIEKTIQSVIVQTRLPMKWIIVSDGSTDKTDDIVERYLEKYPFIELLRRKGDEKRNFGSQVHAINAGYGEVCGLGYDYIGNLDADVSFASAYYATLLGRFNSRPRLGLAGGCIYEEQEGQFRPRRGNRTTSVPHAIQLFKKGCFEDVGGYVPLRYGGPDWQAEVTARMKGWEVESFSDLPVNHHKPTLTAEGMLRGGFRQGRMDYSLGSNPLFEVFKCLARIRQRPYGLYSVFRLAGFILGYVIREERPVSAEFMKFLRAEQSAKMMSRLR